MGIRPLPLMLIALVGMGVAKLTLSVSETEQALPAGGNFFAGPANAATSTPQPEPEATPVPQATQASAELNCDMPEEMLLAIKSEREMLEDQKAALARREAEIDLAGEKTRQDQAELAELKTELEALLAKVEAAQTDDVRRLVALYSNMKPKEAAAIMNDLDIEVSVMVLGSMNERTAAPILANLTPIRARAISKIILERSKLPGDQRLDNLKL